MFPAKLYASVNPNQLNFAVNFSKLIGVLPDNDAANSSSKYESVDLNECQRYKSLDLFSRVSLVALDICYSFQAFNPLANQV